MLVARASTRVSIIIKMYNTDGIMRCFFFIAFKWPDGVERKQLEAMLSTWHRQNKIANAFTSNPENTNTKVTIHDITKPTTEQAKKPYILCLYESLGQILSSLLLETPEKMLSLSC